MTSPLLDNLFKVEPISRGGGGLKWGEGLKGGGALRGGGGQGGGGVKGL